MHGNEPQTLRLTLVQADTGLRRRTMIGFTPNGSRRVYPKIHHILILRISAYLTSQLWL